VTLVIALWGAIVATLNVLWTIWRDARDRGRAEVDVLIGVSTSAAGHVSALGEIEITNIGRRELRPMLVTVVFDGAQHEVGAARERALRAGLASFEQDRSAVAEAVRQEFIAHLGSADVVPEDATRSAHNEIHLRALQAARQAVLAMRASDEIGDDAFHQMEEELDWIEMAGGGREGEIISRPGT
jgi:hypothetical protein